MNFNKLKYFKIIFLLTISCFLIDNLKSDIRKIPTDVGVQERLGNFINLDTEFLNEENEVVTLRNYIDNKHPLVIIPSYFECTRLCNFIFKGVQKTVDELSLKYFDINKDYKIVSISISPKDDAHSSMHKGEEIRGGFKNTKVNDTRWAFLRGKGETVSNFMRKIGFSYKINPKDNDDIAHVAVVVFLSPDGKITRYLYGVNFSVRDFRMALLEAGEGKIGNTLEKLILYCFHYNPIEGKYTPFAWAFIRIGGVITLLSILLMFYLVNKKNKKLI